MTTNGLGEFGRIRRFFAPLAGPGGLALMDDAALVDCRPGHRLVVTVDQAVENVHFLPDDPPKLVAKKLLRRNLSDLAAMGARPLHYLLTTALPAARGDDWLKEFAAGLAEDQAAYGIHLVGGDSTSTNGPVSLTLTAIGEVADGAEVRRSGAKPGDRIWVTGTIGDAFLGLKVLRGDKDLAELEPDLKKVVIARFRLPEPRTVLGPRLVGVATAMIDVSDGLLADLAHVCEASGCGGSVAAGSLPFSRAALAVLAKGWVRPDALATGGDDYELLFTTAPEANAAVEALATELALGIAAIGTIDRGAGVRLVDARGKPIRIESAGWQHF
jgi:thiamine-monophosphate kinase